MRAIRVPVLARRLSNAEFDYTIRDLTGVDIRPTREFPVDPANEAGFDNSGESLTMSPALVKKYLAAARLVADHLVLKPDGFVFAPIRGHRHRPRQVLRPADHRLLPAARGRLRRLLPGRLAVPAPRRARQAASALERLCRRSRAEPPVPRHVWAILTEPWPRSRPARRGSGPVAEAAGRRRRHRTRPGVAASGCATWSSGLRQGDSSRAWTRCRSRAFRRAASPSSSGGTASSPRSGCVTRGTSPTRATWSEFCRVFPDTFFVSDRAPYFDPKARHDGPAPDGRLPPDARLLPRRRAALRAGPRRGGPARARCALAGAGFRDRWPRCGSTRTSSSSSAPSRRGSCGKPGSTSPAPRTRTRPPKPR